MMTDENRNGYLNTGFLLIAENVFSGNLYDKNEAFAAGSCAKANSGWWKDQQTGVKLMSDEVGNMSFSENLQTIRKKNHMSQEELADLLGVSRQAVSKWENGEGYPEVEKLLILSKKLNISLDSLMAGSLPANEEPQKSASSMIRSSLQMKALLWKLQR